MTIVQNLKMQPAKLWARRSGLAALAIVPTLLVGTTAYAASPASTPSMAPLNAPAPSRAKTNDWPRLPAKPALPSNANQWSTVEIDTERARCTVILKGVDVVAIPSEPIRDGECGAAAPVELISVGNKPQVSFSPPVIVTCDMAVAINRWVKELQPIAKRYLGSEIARVDTMSSYSCRNAYGRRSTRLSEHGKANALDIRGFMTLASVASNVLDDWGPTGRDIQAQVAAAKEAAKKAEAVRAAATLRGTQTTIGAAPPGATGQPNTPAAANATKNSVAGTNPIETSSSPSLAIPSVSAGARGSSGIRIGAPDASSQDRSLGLSTSPLPAPLGRLGGPMPRLDAGMSEPASTPKSLSPATDARARFHRSAHETACRIFGTVLGPEANEAHRNHLHIDLAERRLNNFCE